jgi:hypothetical protein
MVMQSVLAVFGLITSSNLVGCCTGILAGFAPLRILSTEAGCCANATRRVKDRTSNRRQRQTRGRRKHLGTKRQLDDAGLVPPKHRVAHDYQRAAFGAQVLRL